MITMSDEEQKGLTGFFSRFGSAKKQTVSEEEIKDIVADNDELADDEKRMIHDIIDLGDMSVHEIMQPRVDMIMVEDTETVRTAVERMHGTGYSRLPIFHEDADHIIGIVHYKNLVGDQGHLSAAQGNANESTTDGHRGGRIRWDRWFNYR